MYILNIRSAKRKMTMKELKDIIFKSYYRRIGFTRENSYYYMKQQQQKAIIAFRKI